MTGMVLNAVQKNLTNNHRRSTAEAGIPFVLLHGLFGSADNWASRTGVYARHIPTIALDLRNHGTNEQVAHMDYPSMADDVLATLDHLGVERCYLLGHSMGGKVAMHLATRHPQRISKLIVVDIAPRGYPPHHQRLINAMLTVPLEKLSKRSEADSILAEVESEIAVRQFLLKSLVKSQTQPDDEPTVSVEQRENSNGKNADQYRWKFNLKGIAQNYPVLAGAIELAKPFDKPVLFIKGAQSSYLDDGDRQVILDYFPSAALKVIDAAGHWPHAEKSAVFDHIVSDFLGFEQPLNEARHDV